MTAIIALILAFLMLVLVPPGIALVLREKFFIGS